MTEPAAAALPEVCRCRGDLREGFTQHPDAQAADVPSHWFVHAACGHPRRGYAEAMAASTKEE